ncbi:MAG: hypothetical protein V2I82_11540 [Halieaceae bacterium]|jgi:hypothetical protein|nr:hypothetical protein [Halieaceae bacterium]
MSRPVEVHIGELQLHGFSRLEARRVEDAFRRELATLDGGGLEQARPQDCLRCSLEPGDRSPEAIGSAAARRLAEGLRR